MANYNEQEEKHLWQNYKKSRSKNNRDALALHYLWYVKFICNRIAMGLPSHVKADDLVSSGVIGLIDAIEKFDDTRKNLFRTYAFTRIRGAILDELRKFDWAPRNLRRRAREIKKVKSQLEQKLKRKPNEDEIASAMKISKAELSHLDREINSTVLLSLEEVLMDYDDQKGLNRIDTIEDKRAISPKFLYEDKEKVELLARQIERLPDKERLVVTLYYYEELNLKEIGQILKISESRVSQLHAQAMVNMRKNIEKMLRSTGDEPESLLKAEV